MAAPILLMNPNTDSAVTAAMVRIAEHHLPKVTGWTAPEGPRLITDGALLDASAAVIAGADIPEGVAGIIVAAFGDPGLAALQDRLPVPVVGIGTCAAKAAAKHGRPFAVATHTPGLVARIDALMRAVAPEADYLGCFLTDDDAGTAQDAAPLAARILASVERAHHAGAERVIIGGGPLAEIAQQIERNAPCPLILPLPEAAKAVAALTGGPRDAQQESPS